VTGTHNNRQSLAAAAAAAASHGHLTFAPSTSSHIVDDNASHAYHKDLGQGMNQRSKPIYLLISVDRSRL
jgi:hypothetical protein